MKKLLCFILAIACLMTSTVALAETKIINPQENRKIKLKKVGLNEVEEGISPTTGLTLSSYTVPEGFRGMAASEEHPYLPVMMQIDNADGGVGVRAPWGAVYADIVYETILYRKGDTRLTFLFNDLLSDRAGPTRSARLAHVWLKTEWGALFLCHGRQEYDGTNVLKEIAKLEGKSWPNENTLYFDNNSGGKKWNKYFSRLENLQSPHNVNVNVAGLSTLVSSDYIPPNHAFKFTDETPKGDTAVRIDINWKKDKESNTYGSRLLYDIDSNSYLRYMRQDENEYLPWIDKDEQVQIAFANVIVQFTQTKFKAIDAPIQYVTGKDYKVAQGNADIFMAGKHIAGYWKRDSVKDRTVYYGPDGEEISLQRGKTLIVIYPDDDVLGFVNPQKNQSYAGNVSYSDKLSGD